MLAVRLALAAVLLLSGIAKLRAPQETGRAARDLGVPPHLTRGVAIALPLVEIVVAAMLTVTGLAAVAAAAAATLLAVFTVLVVTSLRRGRRPACACFGALSTEQAISSRTVIRNLVLFAMAVAVFVAARSGGGCAVGCYDAAGLRQIAVGALLVAVAGLGILAVMVGQLSTLVGELSSRVRELEGRATVAAGGPRPADPALVAGALVGGQVRDAAGVTYPVVDLLEDRDRTLVLFLSAHCPSCTRMVDELQHGLGPEGVAYLGLIDDLGSDAAGEPAALVRDSGADRLRVFADGQHLAGAAGIVAYPSAIMLDPAGRPSGQVMVGTQEIRTFLRSAQEAVQRVP